MALKGIKVLEFTGLAPGPFCGKILSDFGASVIRIDKTYNNSLDVLQYGKKTLALNIKNVEAQNLIKSLCKKYDVLLEPYRPGVMEKYDLGPDTLLKENPKLIYARLTGFGQTGPLASRAGHDINYVGLSGVLSFLGRKNEKPIAPVNLLADFAGGGLLCALGICLALLERTKSNKGQIIDNSMVDGCAYIASWLTMSQELPIWGKERGENILDSGAFFYDTYKTKDGKYMSVGALEPQFYTKFIEGLGLSNLEQYCDNEEGKRLVTNKFLTKTQKEWMEIFEKIDACVFPVTDWKEASKHDHNKFRNTFKNENINNMIIPNPAPKLSRTPGMIGNTEERDHYKDAIDILQDIDLKENDVRKLIENKIILFEMNGKL